MKRFRGLERHKAWKSEKQHKTPNPANDKAYESMRVFDTLMTTVDEMSDEYYMILALSREYERKWKAAGGQVPEPSNAHPDVQALRWYRHAHWAHLKIADLADEAGRGDLAQKHDNLAEYRMEQHASLQREIDDDYASPTQVK